jgi:hypothetical protein
MSNYLRTYRHLLVLVLAVVVFPASSTLAKQVGLWNFNDSLNNDKAGGAPMSVLGGWTPTYVSQTIGGSPATVLSFPSMSDTQALDMPNEAGPNGPNTLPLSPTVNKWSIVMDVKFPTITGFTALWEAEDVGSGDADYFIRGDFDGIGTTSQYAGTFVSNTWTRLAVTVDAPTAGDAYQVNGYIDGVWTGVTATTSTAPAGKEAVRDFLHLFTDEDDETAAGLVNSVAYYGEVIDAGYIATLGGATAGGIPAAANQVGRWNFDNNLNNAVSSGAAMSALGGWTPAYVNESIGGSPATVLSFPKMTNSQALEMPNQATPDDFGTPATPPTGTNVWTIVMDVRFASSGDFNALWETSEVGTDSDADYFARDEEGIGTSGQYGGGPLSDPAGTYNPTEWRRIAVTVDGSVAGEGYKLNGYIDGVWTGVEAITDTTPDGKEAIEEFLHLFADNDFETSDGFVNSVAFYDELLSPSAIATLGAASAAGIPLAALADDADFNNDGHVDGKDFLIWQRGYGIGTNNSTGDANNSGTVDAADLAIWQNLYGSGSLIASMAVPEPSSCIFLALGYLGLGMASRRR